MYFTKLCRLVAWFNSYTFDLQINHIKKSGGTADATTFGRNHKQAFEEKGLEVIPQQDKTIEELKKEVGQDKNIEQERYVRDSEVSWLNEENKGLRAEVKQLKIELKRMRK